MSRVNKDKLSWHDGLDVVQPSSPLTNSEVIEEILKLSPEKRRPQAALDVGSSPSSAAIMSPMRRLGMRSAQRRTNSSPYHRHQSPNKSIAAVADSPSRRRRARCNLTAELCASPNKKQPPPNNADVNSPRNISRRILEHTTKCVSDTIGALHSSIPDELLERKEERGVISSFIMENARDRKSKSLYISGKPGTGKTACVMTICEDKKVKSLLDDVIVVNCMSITSTLAIYNKLARRLGGSGKEISNLMKSKKFVENQLSSDQGRMILVILDEMDQLDGNEGDDLYQIFDWVSLQNSRLLLIGIANSLDLTDRVLPRLQVNTHLKPQLLNFKPYTSEQLQQIIEARLPQQDKYAVIDRSAIQLCAKKVAAKSGDARSSLDICRRAIEMVAQQGGDVKKVGVLQICSLMAAPSSSTMKNKQDCSLPMEQKLIICALLKITKKQKVAEVNIGKLYEVYCNSCQQKGGAVSQSDFIAICNSLEDRRVFDILKKNKNKLTNRQSKVKFAILESEMIESYFKGDVYFESVLKQLL